jgi:hypothetical protein
MSGEPIQKTCAACNPKQAWKNDINPELSMQTTSHLGCCASEPVVETAPKNHGMMTTSRRAEVSENYDYYMEK